MLETILQKECLKRSLPLESFSYTREPAQGSVHGYCIKPKSPEESAQKKTVLFIHGFGNDSLFPQIPLLLYLAEAGLTVFTIDLDGHGKQSTSILFPEHLLSCIRDAVHFVREKNPEGPLHLIGHSLGAFLCLHASLKWELGIQSLVLISLPTDIRLTSKALMKEAFLSLWTTSLFGALRFYKFKFLPALGTFGRSRFPLRFRKSFHEGARELARFVAELQKDPRRSPFPTLYCYGTRDTITPLQHEHLLLKADDELFILKGETHLTTALSPLLFKKN